MKTYKTVAALLCAALTACGLFDENQVKDITGPVPDGAYIRFFNFSVNGPSVNFYADTRKMTAINSATGVEATTGVAYGGVGAGGFYTVIDAGPHTLTGNISATVDKDLAISSTPVTLEAGKIYSYYLSGFYNTTTKQTDAFIIEDNYPATIDFSVATVRFVHAMSNANPMTLYAKNTTDNTETAVGTEIAYKGATAFITLPGGVYDLSTRYAGTATNAIARTGVSFLPGRTYTITSRGDITVVSTTATNRPFLDNTANR